MNAKKAARKAEKIRKREIKRDDRNVIKQIRMAVKSGDTSVNVCWISDELEKRLTNKGYKVEVVQSISFILAGVPEYYKISWEEVTD